MHACIQVPGVMNRPPLGAWLYCGYNCSAPSAVHVCIRICCAMSFDRVVCTDMRSCKRMFVLRYAREHTSAGLIRGIRLWTQLARLRLSARFAREAPVGSNAAEIRTCHSYNP